MTLGISRRAASVLVLVLVVVVTVVTSVVARATLREPAGRTATLRSADYVSQYGGDRDVYQRILDGSGCATAFTEFDQAEGVNMAVQPGSAAYRHSSGYMRAATDRMRALGC